MVNLDLAFHGWIRRNGKRWQIVITADAYDSAWNLLREVERVGNNDLVVLKKGDRPPGMKKVKRLG